MQYNSITISRKIKTINIQLNFVILVTLISFDNFTLVSLKSNVGPSGKCDIIIPAGKKVIKIT